MNSVLSCGLHGSKCPLLETVLDYTKELFQDICEDMVGYHQTGYTVCGAEDPAVIVLGDRFGELHPELSEYSVVRVIDKYLNPWNSATLLEFSNRILTEEEEKISNYLMGE